MIPFLAYTLGLRTVEASRAGILATIEPMVATLIGILLFSEPLTLLSGLGILLILAALTSAISMHEEVTAFFVDHYHTSRRRAATYMTLTTIVLSSLCALSFGPLANFKPFVGRGFFDAFDDVTALWIMPLSGIVLSVFVGWRLPKALVIEELTNNHTLHFPRWLFVSFFFLIRWVAPIAITLIFINELVG